MISHRSWNWSRSQRRDNHETVGNRGIGAGWAVVAVDEGEEETRFSDLLQRRDVVTRVL